MYDDMSVGREGESSLKLCDIPDEDRPRFPIPSFTFVVLGCSVEIRIFQMIPFPNAFLGFVCLSFVCFTGLDAILVCSLHTAVSFHAT